MNARAYCASFGFGGTDQQKKCAMLSGGERNRVHLAKALSEGGNVLLLDEPTNDLDVNTLRALEDALTSFAGCAVVVSHDRWFLDRVATHILAFEGDSAARLFVGNWSDYEERLLKEGGEELHPAPCEIPHAEALRRGSLGLTSWTRVFLPGTRGPFCAPETLRFYPRKCRLLVAHILQTPGGAMPRKEFT